MDNSRSVLLSDKPRKGRTNWCALAGCVCLPCSLFWTTCWVTSFYVRYTRPTICCFILACCFAAVLFTGSLARLQGRKAAGQASEPTWYLFLAGSMLAAWVLGISCGQFIYAGSMEPYYDLANLNFYPNVEPASYQGQQLMDAGRVLFKEGTQVNITKAAGFRQTSVYCVAPIVSGDPKFGDLASYDFWAVGKDCCSTTRATEDFHCGDVRRPQARGGIRLMDDADRPMYQMALRNSLASNGIQARSPLFFKWVEDPIRELKTAQKHGYNLFVFWTLLFFAAQAGGTAVAALAFAKHGSVY